VDWEPHLAAIGHPPELLQRLAELSQSAAGNCPGGALHPGPASVLPPEAGELLLEQAPTSDAATSPSAPSTEIDNTAPLNVAFMFAASLQRRS